MNQHNCAAPSAIKKDSPVTLAQTIDLLQEEYTSVKKELAAIPGTSWPDWTLINREQELHTTLDVLQRLP